ncbi:GntR family transcriptional regulator [Pseudodonghicola flavimaris]|uniref:GntR family transcriptional regulator n=1 Tax=Pseudodonghicola flavimaris TaxID=3050036 RepID=A0ABT7F216_9RHOB|nr:GntR family transcriptional regulator [Pseudodonghicola flavimaris]MDK3018643.1 GntR family transcriptional regulator [Pseudodonghicola flavimaris]
MTSKTEPMTDDEIHHEIFDAIVEGRLSPGEKLGQDDLGKVFGVSKTRIRPILHRLADQKIVVIEPMRGAFVARPSVEEARTVNAARQIIEEGVIRAATRLAQPRHIRMLRDIVAEEQSARDRRNGARAHRLTGEFHCELARITGNDVVSEMVRELVSRDSLVVALYQRPASSGCSLGGHADLIDKIAAGDENAAAHAMRHHLQDVMDSLDLGGDRRKSQALATAFAHLERPD